MNPSQSRSIICLSTSVFLLGLVSSGPVLAVKKMPKDIGDLSCATDQVAKYDGAEWVCADDVDTNTDTLGALECSTDQIAKFDGSEWICADDIAQGPGPKTVFVTASLYRSNLDDLFGADQICNEAARNAGLPGSYRAWLSNSMADAIDRLTPGAGPYERVDGTTIALDNEDLTDGTIDAAISINQRGEPVTSSTLVWTGTTPDGVVVPPVDFDFNCLDWGGGGLTGFLGDATETGWEWTYAAELECGESARLYCVQQ